LFSDHADHVGGCRTDGSVTVVFAIPTPRVCSIINIGCLTFLPFQRVDRRVFFSAALGGWTPYVAFLLCNVMTTMITRAVDTDTGFGGVVTVAVGSSTVPIPTGYAALFNSRSQCRRYCSA